MGFLNNIFEKVKGAKKKSVLIGGDPGVYIGSDEKLGLFLEGEDEKTREEIKTYLVENLKNIDKEDTKGSLRKILEEVNEKLNKEKKELSAVIFYELEKYLIVLHIGLSRAYIVKDNEIIQLTEDDTAGWNLFKTGTFDEEKLKTSPLGKMLVKSLGKNKGIQVNTSEYYFSGGEKLLILSGEKAMEYGDEKLYDTFSGSMEINSERFNERNYLLKTF